MGGCRGTQEGGFCSGPEKRSRHLGWGRGEMKAEKRPGMENQQDLVVKEMVIWNRRRQDNSQSLANTAGWRVVLSLRQGPLEEDQI